MTRDARNPARRALLAAPLLLPAAVRAQSWPARPLRLVVPFAPGGTTDVIARVTGEWLSPRLGQPVVIENRPGAGATIGAQFVARAEPDGLTLFMTSSTSHGVSPAVYATLGYDPMADFTHIALLSRTPAALLVGRNHPARDYAALMDEARRHGELRMAIAAIGTASHLATVRFGMAAGLRVETVVYRGTGPAITDVIAGVVPALFDSLPSAVGHVSGGSLRALALAGEARTPLLPGTPTLRELGLDVVSHSWFGLSAPARLPAPIVARLSQEVAAMFADPAMRARFEQLGGMPPATTPESYTRFIAEEIAAYAPLVRAANITPQ